MEDADEWVSANIISDAETVSVNIILWTEISLCEYPLPYNISLIQMFTVSFSKTVLDKYFDIEHVIYRLAIYVSVTGVN